MSDTTITARIFEALNANPNAAIEDLRGRDKKSTVTAARYFWHQTRHKTYKSSSSVQNPVETARKILTKAAKQGLDESEGRDLAIDAGVAHGTAFSVAAHVYRDFRLRQRDLRAQLKGRSGRWTVDTAGDLELPVCHNIRVDWTQDPPRYHDPLKKSSKKYQHWLSALQTGYAVIQKGEMENGIETRTRDGYLGIYRIDRLEVKNLADGENVDVTFRLTEEVHDVPDHAIKTGETSRTHGTTSELRNMLLRIARGAEQTTKQSGKETTTISKWKEFGFDSADAMADHLEVLLQKQQGLCALSGVQMTIEAGDWCLSPDRINSDGHYTSDNIQLVARCVNMMKGATPDERFRAQLEAIKTAGR